jgi:maltose alpha-D-glucosyltransferase/alpha-amylase
LKVITELVINHTSDQHAWFQRARRAAPGSAERNFYVWSDDPNRYRDARIIFKDFETSNWSWDPIADAYYWHRFYHHQPDLNFEEPAVKQGVLDAMDFWFEMGVDGMRLDAVPYLYEREGTNCENLPETHGFLKELRRHLDDTFDERMLLAEANQWPEDAVEYFGDGDECHMCFHFPVMPRLFMAVRQEDRFPIIDILEQTPAIPENAQWATFLRNHDELTLEMVTDEDRDYMYRQYAAERRARINLGIRRRLAPLMGNDRRRVELMNALLFSLPGAPVLYYGDEIGMGDNIYLGDRNGVRTPMQWSSDRNAGFSRANPQKLFLPVIVDPEYHFEAINVEAQESNPHSLLWWTRRLIALRKRYKSFSRGTIEFLYPANPKVLAFIRRHEGERVLVVANLSRFVQHVELDLRGADADLVGAVPMELFGRNPFPRIGDWPYLLTLGPHGFYWFSLEREREDVSARPGRGGDERGAPVPTIAWKGDWHDLFVGDGRGRVDAALEELLAPRRWFGGKARTVRHAALGGALPIAVGEAGADAVFALAEIDYAEGEAERYALFVAHAEGEEAERVLHDQPWAVYARLDSVVSLKGGSQEGGAAVGNAAVSNAAVSNAAVGNAAVGNADGGILYDALLHPAVARALLAAMAGEQGFRDGGGALSGHRTAAFERARTAGEPGAGGRAGGPAGAGGDGTEADVAADDATADDVADLEPRLSKAEQSNTSIIFGERFILKLFRKLEPGVNPDLEVGRFLTERAGFPHTPAVVGWIDLRRGGESERRKSEPLTVGILQEYVQNEGDAWSYTLGSLGRFFERVLVRREAAALPAAPPTPGGLVAAALALAALPDPDENGGLGEVVLPEGFEPALIATYLDSARLLGERTAELHLALASDTADTEFAPEAFGTLYQRSLYQSMRTLTGRSLQLLEERSAHLDGQAAELAARLLGRRGDVLGHFGALLEGKLAAQRIRIHGDYHLGQVLYTGRDFLIIDFEGEPARALSERRIKRSPLRDVAGMVRSFDYAAHSELARQIEGALVSRDDAPALAGWARWWQHWVSARFLAAYLKRLGWLDGAGGEAGGTGGSAGAAELIPPAAEDLAVLLDVYLLEKAIYELRYELNNRPDWVAIPLAGILELLEGAA